MPEIENQTGSEPKPVTLGGFNILGPLFTGNQGMGAFFGLLIALLFVVYPLVEYSERGRTFVDIFF